MPYDQQAHPEIRKGERWLTNGSSSISSPLKTKRQGEVAYNIRGEVIKDMYPWFVTIAEQLLQGKSIEQILNGGEIKHS